MLLLGLHHPIPDYFVFPNILATKLCIEVRKVLAGFLCDKKVQNNPQ